MNGANMVESSILKSLTFFDEMSDDMLRRLAEIAKIKEYSEGEVLGKQRREAKYLSMVLEGEISLEFESLTGKLVRLETIVTGGTIGISSLIEIEDKTYMSDARALVSPTRVLEFLASDLMLLFYQNFELGFLFMRQIARVAKRRLMYRTHLIPQILALPKENTWT